MGKKVLITGAGGYIGQHVIKKLIEIGADVSAVDVCFNKIDPAVKIYKEDIFSSDESVYERLGSPDVCLHMAWKDGFNHNSIAHMGDLSEHYRFIQNMVSGGLKQIVVMGSMHEVGYHEGMIKDDTPCNPLSYYGIAKDALRRSLMLMAEQRNLLLQWIRAYYIYGDDERSNSIFGKLIRAAEAGEKKFPFTTGKNKYDFIHVDELAKQIVAVLMQEKVGGIINCCSGKAVSLAEQVEKFIKINQLNIELEYGKFPDREYDSPAVWGDNTKIKKILDDTILNNL